MIPTIALVGNPNVGKTSLFNMLTGARQYVANWPGVTVEIKKGTVIWRGKEFKVVDLPGIYSLGAISLDEKISREYIIKETPDVVVVVVDALNMAQGLYLLMEVLEMRENVILVVNAVDEARKSGVKINKYELEKHFGVHAVLTSAVSGEGIEELLGTINHIVTSKELHSYVVISYPEDVEKDIKKLENEISRVRELKAYKPRWLAVKFLEGDIEVKELFGKYEFPKWIEKLFGKYSETIPMARYKYIDLVIKEAVTTTERRMNISEAIDHVLTHRFLGIPIFLSFMYLAFKFTFDIMEPFSHFIDVGLTSLAENLQRVLGGGWLSSLVCDGIVGGVGSVLVFVPNIFGMFIALGFMEETGYLPRAAFVVDRIMYKLKLSGRSFMSLLLGFGCNVPSVMSTRTISDPQERLVTILSSPFITCSARLPAYLLIVGIFFKGYETSMIFLVYLSSIFLTALTAWFWNRVLYKGKPVPLVMELPRYRLPTLKNLSLYVWNKGKHFLEKAGTIILLASVVIWFLGNLPPGADVEDTFASQLGKFLQPIFAPLNFNWKMVTALTFGVAAKEVIVSTLNMLYGAQNNMTLSAMLIKEIPVNTALAYLFFIMAYFPCIATLITMKTETGNWRWAFFSILYSFVIAYLVAFMVSILGVIL